MSTTDEADEDRGESPNETSGAGEAGDARALTMFAAKALEWPSVLEVLREHASTSVGVRALRELVPRDDLGASSALRRSAEMQELLARSEGPPLGGITDPAPPFERARRFGRAMEGDELWALARFLFQLEVLATWLAARREEMPRCEALWSEIPDLSDLRQRLEAALDARGRVVDEASPALKSLRREVRKLSREIERVVKEVAARNSLRGVLADGHAGQVLRRGGRLVVAVRARMSGRVPGIVHDRSQSGETVFIEPQAVVEKANRMAAAEADAEREVARILAELTHLALRQEAETLDAAKRVGELELAIISARWALAVDGRVARLPGEPDAGAGMVLRTARHPLLLNECAKGKLDKVVPLDLRLGGDFDLLVVTGPNTGGKTLALKTAGLAALLTRMGLAVPCAEGTTVPLYDGIVADIGDEQEIEQNLSTFSSHLKRIREGLERTTERTLFLLDELGGGTDPAEGAALGDAILEHLLKRGVSALASTHLGQLKEFAFRHARAENAHVEFDLDTLAPSYKLIIGAPGESRALAIARRLDFPAALVEEAEKRLVQRPDETLELMASMRDVRIESERLRGEAEERLAELEGRIRTHETKLEALDEREKLLEAEAQRGLEERVDRAREWAKRARSLLEQLAGSKRRTFEEVVEGLEEALGDALMTDRRRDFLASLKKGDFVWLPRFKKRCQVQRIHRERRELVLKMGRQAMTVGFDDVTFYESL